MNKENFLKHILENFKKYKSYQFLAAKDLKEKLKQKEFIKTYISKIYVFSYNKIGDYMAIKGVVIDPGHGGTDPGAISNGLKEKDFTLLISKYMYDRLKELGVPVRLTRDSDVTLTPKERVDKVQSFFGDGKDVVVISNHLNAGGGEISKYDDF